MNVRTKYPDCEFHSQNDSEIGADIEEGIDDNGNELDDQVSKCDITM